MNNQIKKQYLNHNFLLGDPLTELFRTRFKFNNEIASIILLVILHIPILILSLIHNLWYFSHGRVGLIQDYGWWILNITYILPTIYFNFWMKNGVQKIVISLIDNKVINITNNKSLSNQFELFLFKFDTWFSNKLIFIFCFILMFSLAYISAFKVQTKYITWQATNPYVFWYTAFIWYFAFSITMLVIIKIIICIVYFNNLFKKFPVDVRVLHPDGAGGLSKLGNFSVKIGYLIALYGISVFFGILVESYVKTTFWNGYQLHILHYFVIVIYILLAPLIFFAPIGSARSAMKKAKNNLLIKISDNFEKETSVLNKTLDKNNNYLKKSIARIEELQKLHSIVQKFPVWPFNINNILRFSSSVLSPFILALLPYIFKKFLK